MFCCLCLPQEHSVYQYEPLKTNEKSLISMKITVSKTTRKDTDTAVITVYSDKKLGQLAADLDKKTGGYIKQTLKNNTRIPYN